MAEAVPPPAVKLICGMIAADGKLFDEAMSPLTTAFGPVDLVSDVVDFDFTHYYDEQMGSPLYRRFVSFGELIQPDALAPAKLKTNAIEHELASRHRGGPARPINLDPGYIGTSKLVLATMKNYSHRIYLTDGVYAEVTLIYSKGKWCKLSWTYPDYASDCYHSFFSQVRDKLRQQVHEEFSQ